MILRFKQVLREFFHDLRAQRTRAFLTTFAVAWGTFSVTMLLAFGEGLEEQMMNGELNAGDRILRIYSGTTSIVYRGLPRGRRIGLQPEDAALLKKTIPEIDMVGPCFGMRVQVERGRISTTDCYTIGVDPAFEDMRRMYPVAGGRFINAQDVEERRRVVFLGHEIAGRLFDGEDPIGKEITIGGFPFTVVGTMPKKFQTSMSNGPDDRRVVIPYTTFHTIWPRRRLWYIAVRPKDPLQHKFVERRIYEVLSQKYRFDPDDERALSVWNAIEDEQTMQKVFFAVKVFLGAVGAMTLLIAGVGIANIMYVVVRERTREIGIKRAIGARRRDILLQFILEALLITGVGGIAGVSLTLVLVGIIAALPLEQNEVLVYFGTPHFSSWIAAFTVGFLMSIGLLSGIFPARRAAQVDPAEALRYE